jgi:hypothetical protein
MLTLFANQSLSPAARGRNYSSQRSCESAASSGRVARAISPLAAARGSAHRGVCARTRYARACRKLSRSGVNCAASAMVSSAPKAPVGLIVCANFRSRFGGFRFRIIRPINPGADQLCIGPRGECATPLKQALAVRPAHIAGKEFSAACQEAATKPCTLGNDYRRHGMFRSAGVAVALALASMSTAVIAQTPQETARNACQQDKMRLCAGVARGEGAIVRCLAGQREQLSEGCRKAFDPYLKAHDPWQGLRPTSSEPRQSNR